LVSGWRKGCVGNATTNVWCYFRALERWSQASHDIAALREQHSRAEFARLSIALTIAEGERRVVFSATTCSGLRGEVS
jgi:hypothetical protein